ncbi:hypothetical protein HY497_01070 [Candidatus Woesearchaeota archaeon]|nr:hypothetical protein [Candidatus Woesearchaeota archaeon]
MEKLRIRRTLLMAMRERTLDDIRILEKREQQIEFLKRKIAALHTTISRDALHLEHRIKLMQDKKTSEKEQMQRCRNLIRLMRAIEEKTKRVYKAEGWNLEKEKKLLNKLEVLFEKHSSELDYHWKNKVMLEDVMQKKRRLLTQSRKMHKEEEMILPIDKQVLENMAAHQVQLISGFSEELCKLRNSQSTILKEKLSVSRQEQSFQRQLENIAAKKKVLKLMLRKAG